MESVVAAYKNILNKLENGYKPSLDKLIDFECSSCETCEDYDGIFINADCSGTINILDTNEYPTNCTSLDIVGTSSALQTLLPFDSHIPVSDGLYNVVHVVLPNIEWLKNINSVNQYKRVFVADSHFVYEYIDGDLITIDPQFFLTKLPKDTNIINYSSKLVLVLNDLWKCYIDKCEDLLEGNSSEESDNNLSKYSKKSKCGSKDTTYDIDFLQITINLLNCLLSQGNLDDIEDILERIEVCGGFCQLNYE